MNKYALLIIAFLGCVAIGIVLIQGKEADSATDGLFTVSAYCKNSCCCGKWADGFTASGKPAVGLIVAAPARFPFGTVMDIPGHGRAVVEDRGGAITGNRLDVLMESHFLAKKWGVQVLKVRIK